MNPTVRRIAAVLGRVCSIRALLGIELLAACSPFEPAVPRAEAHASAEPPTPVRRLSHAEYRATLRDLFPSVGIAGLALVQDEKLRGFSNNYLATTASPLLVSQYQDNALLVAEEVGKQLPTFSCPSGDRRKCAEEFIRDLAPRAYRRPLTTNELTGLLTIFDKPALVGKPYLAAELAVVAILQSPQFLYHFRGSEAGDFAAFERASRLSYFLWASLPDAELFEAAAKDKLEEPEQVRQQIARMLEDPKAEYGISLIFKEWLKLDKVNTVLKLPQDKFDKRLASELSDNATSFVFQKVFKGNQGIQSLLLDNDYAPTPGIERLLAKQDASPSPRAGILTHPAFLAAHAYARYPSPVLRGVFVLERILCTPPRPPPPGTIVTAPEPDPKQPLSSNRDRYNEATRGRGCASCHKTINQFGFAFENYDTLGRFMTTDGKRAIDATGKTMGFQFADATDLARQLANSERYERCVSDTWLNYAFGGAPDAQESQVQEAVVSEMRKRSSTFRGLVEAIALHPAFLGARSL